MGPLFSITVTFVTCLVFVQAVTPEIIEHARAGTDAMKQGRPDVAVQEFRKVVELQPDSPSGHANLGEAYFQIRDYMAAIPELQRALELNPQMMGTHQTLGVALLVEGDTAGALPHLEKARTPELVGLAYLETGRFGSALMAFREALERRPDDPDLLYYFGRSASLAAKRVADQLARTNPDAAQHRETAENGAPDPIQEAARLESELAGKPNDPDLLIAFRRTAELASREAFARIAAGSARAHQIAAERLVTSGSLAGAEKEYEEAIRLKPYTSGVHLALGDVLLSEGKWPQAISEFRGEAALRPLNVDTLYRLGFVLLQRGQPRDAQTTLTQADKLQPNTPVILLALGQAALGAEDIAQAEGSWKKLLAIDSSSEFAAQAHLGLASIYKTLERPADAEREMAAYQQLENKGKH